MLDWNDLRYFLAIHRGGTLAGAAALLKINATTVGRRLSALEEQMHTRLFDRTPNGYALTLAGRELLPRAEQIEINVLAVERELSGADQRAEGIVRVNVTEMLATRFITAKLPRFIERHPAITLEFNCTRRSVSLGRREADIALRLARPYEEDVITHKLATIDLALYASRAYLDRHGMPDDPERRLAGQRVMLFADSRAFSFENDWFEPRLDGASVVMRSDSVSSIFAATLAGSGIALLPRACADPEPTLVRIETQTYPEPRVVWQTVHVDLAKSARVRAVLEFLSETLRGSAAG